jgi:hypothetical protein
MAKLSESNAEELKESLKAAGINFVVYVPDSWSHLLLGKTTLSQLSAWSGKTKEWPPPWARLWVGKIPRSF